MYRTTTTYAGTFETFIMAARSTTYDYMHDSHRSYICSIEGWREDRRSVKIWFRKVVNGQPVDSLGLDPKSISTSSTLDALEKCMDLAIDICCGNDPVSICAVQDTFFALVGRIPNNHRLRSLAVTITVVLPNDANERSWIVSDIWPASFLQKPTIYENKIIQPGDLSRMHMVAFLTDPLRKTRKLGGDGKTKHISLIFSGRTGEIWKEIAVVVKDLVCGDSDVKDYEIFPRNFDGIRYLTKSIQCAIKNINKLQDTVLSGALVPNSPESLASTPVPARMHKVIDLTTEAHEDIGLTTDASQGPMGMPGLRVATKALAMARIRGSFKDLNAAHHSLLKSADEVLMATSRSLENEQIVGVLQQNRDYAASIFPKSVDVSCYGYNESDTKLAEYRSDPEGYVLRKANLESKRKQARGQDA
jgi:hypothetical protein